MSLVLNSVGELTTVYLAATETAWRGCTDVLGTFEPIINVFSDKRWGQIFKVVDVLAIFNHFF